MFLTSGLVANCNLVKPTTNGYGTYAHNIKKIGIWVLVEEFDAMMAYFGKVFNKDRLLAQYFADVVYFQTQRDAPNKTGKLNEVLDEKKGF